MFNVGFGELVLVLLIGFLVVGPKDLPKIGRTLARGLRELRKFMGDLKDSVDLKDEDSYIRDVVQGIAEMKAAVEEANPATVVKKELASLNPLGDVQEELTSIKKSVNSFQNDVMQS